MQRVADHLIPACGGASVEWRGVRIPRLVAGTAQLGMPYGIANSVGAPTLRHVMPVIEAALECGIRFFDTAQAYGESEAFLGRALSSLGATGEVRVISKLDPKLCPTDARSLLVSLEESVGRLGGPLWAVLLHRASWLDFWEDGVGSALQQAQRQGMVAHLGASVYTVEEAIRALEHEGMDIVQAPASAWDQRIERAGVFRRAAERNKLCCARSIFLQGLLTLAPEVVAARLPFARRASERWSRLAGSGARELAVRCALALHAPVIVGMESADQVRENARLFELDPLSQAELDQIHGAMSEVLDERILNPSRWP